MRQKYRVRVLEDYPNELQNSVNQLPGGRRSSRFLHLVLVVLLTSLCFYLARECSTVRAQAYDLGTLAEWELVDVAIVRCPRASPRTTDAWAALWLLRLERQAGVPPGLLLATWCWEAGMRTRAWDGGVILGDLQNGVWRAVGPFQLHESFRAACKGNRKTAADFAWSAHCYLSRILYRLPQAVEDCGEDAGWRVAEARVANAPRYLPWGCAARSEHWRLMEEVK